MIRFGKDFTAIGIGERNYVSLKICILYHVSEIQVYFLRFLIDYMGIQTISPAICQCMERSHNPVRRFLISGDDL